MTPAVIQQGKGGRRPAGVRWALAGAWSLFLILAFAPVAWPMASLCLRLLSGDGFPRLGSWTLGWHSLALAAACAALAMIQGLGLALWFASGRGVIRLALRRLYLVPLLLPPYMYALAWMALFARDGWASSLFRALSWGSPTPYGFSGSALVLGMAFAPLVTWMALGSLKAMDAGPVEAAYAFGGPARTWFRVLLPAVAPSALAGASLAFAFGLVEYGVPSLLQFNVYSMELYADFSQSGDAASAAGLALPILLPALALAVAVGAFGRILPGRSASEGQRAALESVALPRALACWAWGSAALGVMALALPFGVLVAEVISGPAAAITMSQGWRPLVFSLALAGTAGLFASLLALPLCWQAGDRPGRFMEATCLAALTLPSPLFGIGVVLLWNRAGAATGALNLALPWIAHLGRFLPLAILIVASHLRQVDPLLWESARLAHAPGWAKALRVALPIALPGMVVAAGFTAALSLGEIGTTLLVCPPGYQTVSLRLYNLLHYGADASAAALALATTAVAATLGTGVWAMARRGWT